MGAVPALTVARVWTAFDWHASSSDILPDHHESAKNAFESDPE